MDTFEVESCVRGIIYVCGINIGGIKFDDFTKSLPVHQIKASQKSPSKQ